MTRKFAAGILVACSMLLPAPTASAVPPPTNPNVAVAGTLSCPTPIGEQTLAFNMRVQDNPIGFLGSGQVVVARRVTDTISTFTITLASDGSLLAGPVTGPEPDEVFGNVPEERLVTCTFALTFEFTAPLDEETAQGFDLDPSLIGQLVTFHADVTGTVQLIPGGPNT
jgi:hypothetical protein